MRFNHFCLVTTGLLYLAMIGCGSDSFDSVTEEMLDTVDELAETLASIENESDAEAARGDLETLAQRLEDIGARAEKLGEPSQEVNDQLQEKYGERMARASTDMMREILRLQQTGAAPLVMEIFSEMGGGLGRGPAGGSLR